MAELKTAFIVWNPFQVVQFQPAIAAYPAARIIVVQRGKNLGEFDPAFLPPNNAAVEIIKKTQLADIDGRFDVIFYQAPIAELACFKASKLVSVQYGLAKERHNYGEWRSLSDMNLMYGPYSVDAVSHFSPSYAVGNIKFAGWDHRAAKAERPEIERRLGLAPDQKTILFMPTYGALGSFDDLVPILGRLATRYNVIIKIHHNTEKRGKSWMDVARRAGITHLANGAANQLELLAISDLVISDFSGAIFDAVYAEVPAMLYQARAAENVGIQKFDLSSLEFSRRDDLGLVCTAQDQAEAAIEQGLATAADLVAKAAAIRESLFIDGRYSDIIAAFKARVDDLVAGRVPALTTSQIYVRDAVQRLMRAEQQLGDLDHPIIRKILATLGKWLGM